MTKYILLNPEAGQKEVFISSTYGGWHLYVIYRWDCFIRPYDDYTFKTVKSAKQYYSRYFKVDKTKKLNWDEKVITIDN